MPEEGSVVHGQWRRKSTVWFQACMWYQISEFQGSHSHRDVVSMGSASYSEMLNLLLLVTHEGHTCNKNMLQTQYEL